MTKSPYTQLEEFKIKASILHKQLKSEDLTLAEQAATRFQQLPHFANISSKDIVTQKADIKRKHALTVIALENKYTSWNELKQKVELKEKLAALRQNKFTMLYPPRCAGFINTWYANYDEAKDHLVHHGGYLLPYKNDYFVCERVYIQTLGLDPDDSDWDLIAFNWAKPANQDAWNRLNQKLNEVSQAIAGRN